MRGEGLSGWYQDVGRLQVQAMPGAGSEELRERSSYLISRNATESRNRGASGVGGRVGEGRLSRSGDRV